MMHHLADDLGAHVVGRGEEEPAEGKEGQEGGVPAPDQKVDERNDSGNKRKNIIYKT